MPQIEFIQRLAKSLTSDNNRIAKIRDFNLTRTIESSIIKTMVQNQILIWIVVMTTAPTSVNTKPIEIQTVDKKACDKPSTAVSSRASTSIRTISTSATVSESGSASIPETMLVGSLS